MVTGCKCSRVEQYWTPHAQVTHVLINYCSAGQGLVRQIVWLVKNCEEVKSRQSHLIHWLALGPTCGEAVHSKKRVAVAVVASLEKSDALSHISVKHLWR